MSRRFAEPRSSVSLFFFRAVTYCTIILIAAASPFAGSAAAGAAGGSVAAAAAPLLASLASPLVAALPADGSVTDTTRTLRARPYSPYVGRVGFGTVVAG